MKGHWRKRVIIGAACTAALLAVSILIWRMSVTSANNRAIESLRRAGIPASREELNDWYPAIPADQNAALLLTEAMQALRPRSAELDRMKLPGRGERLTNATPLKAHVETNQAALELINAALERPQSRYAVNFLAGFEANAGHLEPLRGLSRLADYAALLAAERGASSEAAEHVATIVGLARTLDNEPILLSQLVRIAMLNVAVRRFERSLSVTRFSEAELSRLARVFAGAARSNCLARALVGERAMMIQVFRAPGTEMTRMMSPGGTAAPKRPGAEELLLVPLMNMSGLFERDLAFYLESMDKLIARTQDGPPQSLAVRTVSDDLAEEARRKYCILTAISLPGLSRAVIREAEALAVLRLAETACAIERVLHAKGSLPDDLAELAPAFVGQVAVDPCDGQPLRYKRLDDGYVLYSVGADGRDDDATEIDRTTSRWKTGPDDVVFKVKTPP